MLITHGFIYSKIIYTGIPPKLFLYSIWNLLNHLATYTANFAE